MLREFLGQPPKRLPRPYYAGFSQPCRSAKYALKAAYIDHEIVNVDFTKNDHRAPDFLKLNPNHAVPVLVTSEGTPITESNAIIRWALKDAYDWYPKDL